MVVVGGIFLIGVRKIVRKFTKGESDCCTSSACGSCQCRCQKEPDDRT